MADLISSVLKIDRSSVDIEQIDKSFDLWVHTGRQIVITKCAPSSQLAVQKLRHPGVYPITRHIRGRVLLISNTGYQALKLLKDLFEQLQYTISIHVEKSSAEVFRIIETEGRKEENVYVDSFVVIIYGTPDNFNFVQLPEMLNDNNAPSLRGKPKLIYVIGNDSIVQQVVHIGQTNRDPDFLIAATGFNGIMFYIYVLCMFVHELSAQDIWKLLSQFADLHRFTATSHCTMDRQFYFFPGLTASVLPEEIQNMDPGDMDLYMKMLETSEMSTYNVRLMFVGLFGAGKTSTARRIMGKTIDGVTSTDGIDVYIGKCKVDIRNDTWQTLEDTKANMPYTKLSRLLLIDEETESKVPDIKNLEYKVDENVATQALAEIVENEILYQRKMSNDDYEFVGETNKRRRTDDVMMASPESSISMDLESTDVKSPMSESTHTSSITDFEMVDSSICNNEYMNTAHRVITETQKAKGPKTKEAFVSLWDFAGQFVYYATHQLFFSPRSIYLLVLNMEDDLDKTLDEHWYVDLKGKESIEAQGGVRFWLQSIYSYAKGSQPGIPPILLVGTHKDKLQGDEQQQQCTANDYFSRISNSFQGTPIAFNIQKQCFLLDNNTADPEIEELQSAIMKVAKTMPYWGEKIPAKWVELEQALEDRRIEGTSFIKMNELKQIDKNLAKPIDNEEQLQLFLKFHHETGTLVYFHDSPNLRDIVVLDPHWIIHAFRYLISAEHFGKKYGLLEDEWRKFMDSGQLEMGLAMAIWEQDKNNRFYENHERLLQFLEKLDIIARPRVIKDDGQHTEILPFYYVPCLLKQPPNTELLKLPNRSDCVSTPVLCYSFKGNFLPPAVFNRLVAICLGRWPVARQGKKNLIYCGCAVFMVSHGVDTDKHRMTMFFRQSKIGVRITRYSSRGARTVDSGICNKVRRVISWAVRKEFARFNPKTTPDRNPFYYQLQCKETIETKLLDEGLNRVEELVKEIDKDHFCEQHSEMMHPHPLSAVDMLQEWFPDEIPPNFRIESASSVDLWIEKMPETLRNERVADVTISKLCSAIGKNWQCLMLDLGIPTVIIEQSEMDNPGNVKMAMLNLLRHWKTKVVPDVSIATNECLVKAIRRCSLTGLSVDWETIQNVIEGLL